MLERLRSENEHSQKINNNLQDKIADLKAKSKELKKKVKSGEKVAALNRELTEQAVFL